MYTDILVPTDGSDEAKRATEHAIELASKFDATVHALYAIEPERTTLPSEAMRHDEMYDDYVQWGESITGDVTDAAERNGLHGVASVTDGHPHEEITEYASENGIDLIVMGTAGRTGWPERLLGSVTEKVIRTADVPVLTMREAGQ